MPVGFNLFSFDLFDAFRRCRDEAFESEASDVSALRALSEGKEDRRLRDEERETASWLSLGYFPVL